MKIAVLGPPPWVGFTPVYQWLKGLGEEVTYFFEPMQEGAEKYIDFVVSHRYRHILSRNFLDQFEGRAVNLHPAPLPIGRGVQSNFFSWLEGTPKGVAIHLIDEGIDSGPILARRYVGLYNRIHTLRSSYEVLQKELFELFREVWGDIEERNTWEQDRKDGTFHTQGDFQEYSHLIWDKGWDTPVWRIEEYGKCHGLQGKQTF